MSPVAIVRARYLIVCLFVKGKDYCTKVPSPPPPSDGNSQKKCVFAPCYKEMADFYNKNIPITSSCCVFIQDVLARCPDFRGDFTRKCNEYCKNHKQSATPPTAEGYDCPPPLPYNLFVKGQDYCIKKTTPPPPPPPPPPLPPHSDDKKCPPSDGVSHPPADSCDVKPCYKEMIYFYNQNCPISSSCCSLILKVVEKYPNMRWNLTLKSNDYCKNHQRSSATPPTSRE
ncbi:hypothetical protein TorRG33x02_342360 [Trema orientale]|uniref:Prolamin-like domain containing protein n=1 Tax=Trema orientale TaxID=63057 RepID=A0A2P5ASR6_TREOI|nr:hypothetical protein TorRG33x02_342360 [Trema orientale]